MGFMRAMDRQLELNHVGGDVTKQLGEIYRIGQAACLLQHMLTLRSLESPAAALHPIIDGRIDMHLPMHAKVQSHKLRPTQCPHTALPLSAHTPCPMHLPLPVTQSTVLALGVLGYFLHCSALHLQCTGIWRSRDTPQGGPLLPSVKG